MKQLLKKDAFVLFFLWFMLIYGPVLDIGFGPLADTSFGIAAALTVRLAWVGVRRFDALMLACLAGVFLLASMTWMLADQGQHNFAFRALLRPFRAAIVYLGIVSLSEYTISRLKGISGNTDDAVLTGLFIIYLSVIVHGLIMTGQFISPGFRNSIYSLTFAKNQLDIYQEFRMAGLSGGGGAQVSAVQGMGSLIGVYLFLRSKARATVILTLPILVISIVLSGRTGLIVVALSFFFGLFMFMIGGMKRFSAIHIAAIVFFTTVMIFFGSHVASLFVGDDYFEIAFNRSFETILQYSETGSFEDRTLIALSEMFVLPDTFLHLLFGQASYIENNTFYGINTDIGYFRLIWAYGMLGLVFHLLFYFGFVLASLTNYRKNNAYGYFSLAMVFLIFFLNSKEIFFLTSMSFPMMGGCILLGRFATKPKSKPHFRPQRPLPV